MKHTFQTMALPVAEVDYEEAGTSVNAGPLTRFSCWDTA